jgi:hypothetical protein
MSDQVFGKPNEPLPTEEEMRQHKLERAQKTGDMEHEVQPSASAAADQLAALIAPTPAIPSRPETAIPPSNVVQRQRANLQPLPTDEELKEIAIEAGELDGLIKKFFWVADDAGEPMVDVGSNAVFLHYPDSSQITIRFECRPGDHQSVGLPAATEAEVEARNKKFSDQKKLRDERRQKAKDAAKEAEELRGHDRTAIARGGPEPLMGPPSPAQAEAVRETSDASS